MLIVITGNGKGKTTASLGQMVRVTGRGKRALMIQFIKGPWKSGEDSFAAHFGIPSDRFEIRKRGLGFVGILGDTLPREQHAEAAQAALREFCIERDSGRWDLIVLDEVNNAVQLDLLPVEALREALQPVPDALLVVCTGRDAHPTLVDMAHLVSEVREVKHPFNDGKWAEAGIEF